ncbi:MAG: hypothetical protein HYY67_07705 [Thaumarchaeota archaeon]|nr:hypothetical protein [Nitrososphaerota archaeon]
MPAERRKKLPIVRYGVSFQRIDVKLNIPRRMTRVGLQQPTIPKEAGTAPPIIIPNIFVPLVDLSLIE